MKPTKAEIKSVMSYLGKKKTPAQTRARRQNMAKARKIKKLMRLDK